MSEEANILSEQELYSQLESEYRGEEDFTGYEYSIMGRVSTGIALLDGYHRPSELQEIYRIGGMYGTLTERVDDLVDGDHGFPAVQDLEKFFYDGLDVIETGEWPEQYSNHEKPAFLTAEKINDLLEPGQAEELRDGLEEMVEITLEEKYQDAGHEAHLESAAAMFENAANLLDMTTAYDSSGRTKFWRDIGKILQITDDKVDGDREVTEQELQNRQKQILQDLKKEEGLKNFTTVYLSEKLIDTAGSTAVWLKQTA